MLYQCGYNEFYQLCDKSNNQSTYKTPVISPCIKSSLDISSLLSYSVFGNHSVIINRKNKIYAIGDNRDNRICGSLPKTILNEYTEFSITNSEGCHFIPICSVCSKYFTLYIVSSCDDKNQFHLALSHKNLNQAHPLFLNINSRIPISIYGGYFNAAAIDSEGAVLFVNYKTANATNQIDPAVLPDGEKAVKLSCCKDVIFALSSNGRLFQSFTSVSELTFSEVSELSALKIVDVSGTFWHCFALCEDGTVFGWGANFGGRLGLGKEIEEVEHFVKIESLNGRLIKSVFAGSTHSLFIQNDGKVLACGSNTCGELFLDGGPSEEFVFTPVETSVKKEAVYCIAGDTVSAAFIGCCPSKCANMKISFP